MSPLPQSDGIRRWPALLFLGAAIVLLGSLVFSQTAFNLTFLHPANLQQTQVFAALSALLFLLLVALTFVLLRNLLKLYAERRIGVLGSRFRTKMVIGGLLLSFAPVIFLFAFAYGLMNRSIDKWFSRPVEELREDSSRVATLLATYAADNAQAEARTLSVLPATAKAFETGIYAPLETVFTRHEASLQGGFAIATFDQDSVASFHAPMPWPELRQRMTAPPAPGTDPKIRTLNNKDYLIAVEPVGVHGRILVALPLPPSFSATLKKIDESQRRYLELGRERKLIRRTYMLALLLLTVLVLFAATWLSLFLSKLVTRPVAALAEATQEISAGRLHHRVEVPAADELGELVASFNRMAAELESNRKQIELSSSRITTANVELEQRRQHIETILESIPTGVLSLDAAQRVVHSNSVFSRLFDPTGVPPLHARLSDLFNPEVVVRLEHLMRKADRMGSATQAIDVLVKRTKLYVAVTVASLQHAGSKLGYVIVFEDFTDLLKAQKQTAWREVARRVAHEIKNPLTPIALSAERIRRHLARSERPDDASLAVISGCAETIAGAVETVRTLVDEFATLARFPSAQPRPADINAVVESALAMFSGRLHGISLETHLAPDLPPVMADPEAMKRAIANLVDNAAEALQSSLVKEIHITTALLEDRDAVEITVGDSGHGVSSEVKEKLFLPYFSTKKRGTGLGLAIVSRIVEDHHGYIRVEENQPLGARFIVELPISTELQPVAQHA